MKPAIPVALVFGLAAAAMVLWRQPPVPPVTTAAEPRFDPAFWRLWGDGQAELAGYELTYPRYGKPRQGVAVAIFVTEPFSYSLRVKADPGRHPDSDVFPVMKLNLVEDFQTGLYDYNEETSSFLALARTPGRLTKVAFSSQEWCGHVYSQLIFQPDRLRLTTHSYFDGEADEQRDLAVPPEGISEEQLFFWARGMARPVVEAGQSVVAPLLPSLQTTRHGHQPLQWTRAKLSRSGAAQQIAVPAGKFAAEVWRAEIEGGSVRTFYVEAGGARRILRWESSTGERAELLGSDRMKYWQMNQPGGEAALKRLGLSLRPPRTS